MAKGHVKLGALGTTLREYVIDWQRWRKSQANPWTTKLNTGGDKYDDLEPFSFHVEQDWQAGVGRKGEDDGGFLFSTAETRVPQQVMLPQNVLQFDTRDDDVTGYDVRNIGVRSAASSIMQVSSTGALRRIAVRCLTEGILNNNWAFSFFGHIPSGVSVTINMTETPGVAGVWTTTITGTDSSPYYRWNTAGAAGTVVVSAPYYVEIYPTNGTIQIVTTASYTNAETRGYDGSSWTTLSGNVHPIHTTNTHAVLTSQVPLSPTNAIIRFNNTLYAGMGAHLVKWNSSTGVWQKVGTVRPQTIRSLVVFNNILFIGQASGVYQTCSTADSYTAGADGGIQFEKWNGYVYKATTTDIFYSADGSSWSSAIPVCKAPEQITGIVGAVDTLWITTTDAIYYLAPGNIIRGVTRWGSSRSENGKSPVNFQGNIYCIADGGIVQINASSGSATVLPIWISRDDDLVASFLDRPIALASLNNWLAVLVQQATATGKTSVWIYNGQGWHFLADVPLYIADTLYYDFGSSALWTGSRSGVFFRIRAPDYTLNPLNDTASRYAPSGWLETPWLSGGLVDTVKDFESVYIKGSELSSSGGQSLTIFWQVRGGSWQELGAVTADGQELRWSNSATRPAAKEIKLGFRLFTTNMTRTPNIEAIRLKFRHNVEDRWAWTLIMPIHNRQEMVDGDINTYTRDQVKAHLESLVKSTPPFTFEDVDGTQYTVISAGYELNLAEYEYYNGAHQAKYVAAVSLEQVTT